MSLARVTATERVLRAALRLLQAERSPEPDPHAGDYRDLASDELALACRELTEAVELDDDKPVGWSR